MMIYDLCGDTMHCVSTEEMHCTSKDTDLKERDCGDAMPCISKKDTDLKDRDTMHCVSTKDKESKEKLFRNKYRIDSMRLPNWDYSSAGYYFITICTQNRIDWFGKIENHKMILSDMGKIVESEWHKTFEMRPDMNLTMGEFVVMPNHFHCVLIIGDNEYNSSRDAMHCISKKDRDTKHCASTKEMHCASTKEMPCASTEDMHCASTMTMAKKTNKFGPQSKNLASVIRGFKIGVTKKTRKIDPLFKWQSLYYDHIIRTETELIRVSQYIKNNPKNWKEDDLLSRGNL